MSTMAERIKAGNPWLSKIPHNASNHGSGMIQKKYWKVTSDFVRIRDFFKYRGECISCHKMAFSWEQTQAGHAKSWAACRGYSKWDVKNIFGQCANCNSFGDATTGANFMATVKERHGKERIEYIAKLDSHPTEKLEDFVIVEKIKALIVEMGKLPVQPEYYQAVISIL